MRVGRAERVRKRFATPWTGYKTRGMEEEKKWVPDEQGIEK
jgi:hypothetical protein